MELVLLKVYMDHVVCRSLLMHCSSRSQAHPDCTAFLCWPKHILQYVCWLMEKKLRYQKYEISYRDGAMR